MFLEFTRQICSELERSGYLVEMDPRFPGVSALMYVYSARPERQGFAKVDDYFLIVDGEFPPFVSEEGYREAYRSFSTFANRSYRVPHGLRMRIPNLAIVALSKDAFRPEIQRFARFTSLNPWYGGETGQVILVELANKTVITLSLKSSGRYPTPGAFPLGHAQAVIQNACQFAWRAELDALSSIPSTHSHL
jgi:hypothetical protein